MKRLACLGVRMLCVFDECELLGMGYEKIDLFVEDE